jgi:hypothetical protein
VFAQAALTCDAHELVESMFPSAQKLELFLFEAKPVKVGVRK